MTKLLCGLAGGRCVLALEGGYNLSSISDSMAACVEVLAGVSPVPAIVSPVPAIVSEIAALLDDDDDPFTAVKGSLQKKSDDVVRTSAATASAAMVPQQVYLQSDLDALSDQELSKYSYYPLSLHHHIQPFSRTLISRTLISRTPSRLIKMPVQHSFLRKFQISHFLQQQLQQQQVSISSFPAFGSKFFLDLE